MRTICYRGPKRLHRLPVSDEGSDTLSERRKKARYTFDLYQPPAEVVTN